MTLINWDPTDIRRAWTSAPTLDAGLMLSGPAAPQAAPRPCILQHGLALPPLVTQHCLVSSGEAHGPCHVPQVRSQTSAHVWEQKRAQIWGRGKHK